MPTFLATSWPRPVASRRRRTRRAALLATLALLVGSTDDAAAQAADPGKVVEFNLERGRILEALPFDVPFYLLAPVPANRSGMTAVRARLIPSSRDGLACVVPKPTIVSSQGPCPRFPQPGGGPCELRAVFVQEKVDKAGSPVPQVEISVPALDARRDYCVGVSFTRPPTTVERQAMADAVGAVLGEAARALGSGPGVVGTHELDTLCASIETAIAQAIGDRELEPVPVAGSATDQCRAGNLLFSTVVVGTAFENLGSAVERAVSSLGRLVASVPAGVLGEPHETLRQLDTEAKRRSFVLGLPLDGSEPMLLTADAATARRDAVRALQATLTPTTVDCAAVTSASPLAARLHCFAEDELAEVEGDLDSLIGALDEASGQRDLALAELARQIADGFDVAATTWDGFDARFGWYWSADEGVAHAWDLGETFSYTGVNVYFSPVNKKAPLRSFTLSESWRRRFALMVGVSNDDIDIPGVEPHFGDRFLLLGAGIRLTDHLRFSTGVLLFDETDPDPLVDAKRNEAYSPFASFSLDVNVTAAFKQFFGSDDG